MPTIESLEIRIKDSASQAANGIDILRSSIEKLKAITKGGVGLASVANSLRKLNTEMQNFKPVKQADFKSLSASLEAISKVKSSSLSSNISALARIPKVTESLDSSTLDKFASKINKIVDALKPLNTELSSIKGSIGSLPKDIKKVSNLTEQSNKSKDEKRFFAVENIKNYLSLVREVTGYLNKVRDGFVDLVEISGKYTENLNLFSVALGKFAKAEKEFAEQSEDLLGIDASEFMRYEAVFMNMTRGFGVASDKAVLMSRNLVQLGYDLSSLYNVQFDTAMEKLESAISGQPRPMREWGFDLSEATLKAKALELGITKNVESMNQAEKSLIRYVQLMDTAEKIGAKGDFAKTITTTANQMRVMSESWNLFVRSVGNVLVPIANQLLPYFIAAAKAARYVADAIASLAGFKLPKVEDFAIDIDMGAEDLEDQLNGADSAAKKLKKTLMGFDELNVLPDQSSGAGTGATSAGGTAFDIDLPSYNFLEGAVESQADKIYNAWKPKLDWFIDNLDNIKTQIGIIGGLLITWKITSSVLTFFSNLPDYINKLQNLYDTWVNLNSVAKVSIGLALVITGATFSYDAGFMAGRGKDSFLNTVQGALGVLATTAGGAIIGGTVAGPWGAVVGAVIGLGVGVLFTVQGYFEGQRQAIIDAFWASDKGQYIKSLKDGSAEILNQSVELKLDVKTSMENMFDTDKINDLMLAQKLIDEIFTLDEKDNKTAVEIGVIQEKINVLNSLGLEGIQDKFQVTKDGFILPTRDSIEEVIDSLLKQFKIEAMREEYIALYKKQYHATKNLETAQENYNKISEETEARTKELNGYSEKYQELLRKRNEILNRLPLRQRSVNNLTEEERKAYEALTKELDSYGGKIKELEPIVGELQDAQADATKALDEATSANGELSDALGTLETDIAEMVSSTKENLPEATDAVDDFNEATGKLEDKADSSKLSDLAEHKLKRLAEMAADLRTGTGAVNDYAGAISGLAGAFKKLPTHFAQYSTTVGGTGTTLGKETKMTYMVPRYASGGYPGDLFIANDGGPEMVGRIGSRTAVVNNDQIVAAVSRGVYAAVKEAFSDSGSSRGGDTVVQIDGREVFRAVVNQNNSVIRSTGNSPLL